MIYKLVQCKDFDLIAFHLNISIFGGKIQNRTPKSSESTRDLCKFFRIWSYLGTITKYVWGMEDKEGFTW